MIERFTWYKQSAYRYDADGRSIYIDPWGIPDDSPPADAIFITHAHFDHFDQDDIARIKTDRTEIVAPRDVADELSGKVRAVAPGDSVEAAGVRAQALPAYNIIEGREQNHPKENNWVGYVFDLGDGTVYHAGDTDHLEELSDVRAGVAFVPIGGAGFTMDATEAAGFVLHIRPQLAVPMHYGFVEGTAPPSDAEVFRRGCDPIEVRVLDPVNPFAFGA